MAAAEPQTDPEKRSTEHTERTTSANRVPTTYASSTRRCATASSRPALAEHGEKLEIAHQLARLGVDIIEAGFPIASPGDFEAVQAIAREVHGP